MNENNNNNSNIDKSIKNQDNYSYEHKPSFFGMLIWFVSFILTCGITAIIYIVIMNGLINSRTKINELASDINVQLKKRRDTLIKLVDASKQYIKYEKSILTDVTKLRTANLETLKDANKVGSQMNNLFGRIFAVGENYPDLKANTTVTDLMDQATYLEKEIAAARRLYNTSVQTYNTKLYMYPSNIAAYRMKLTKFPYFEISDPKDKEDVKIDLV